MASLHAGGDQGMRWLRNSGRGLALLWASWWVFFGLASGIGEGLSPAGIFVHTAVPGLVFLASAVVAWRWEAIGGALLLVEGLFVAVAYPLLSAGRMPLATVFGALATMALPPLIAGSLLLACWWKSRIAR